LSNPLLIVGATTPNTIRQFLLPHLLALRKDFDIEILTNLGGQVPKALEDFRINDFPVVRTINVAHDFMCLISMIRLLREKQPVCMLSLTPKMNLLFSLAGLLVRCDARIICVTGQVWGELRNIRDRMLMLLDKFVCNCATLVVVDGRNQVEFLRSHGFCSNQPAKMIVLGKGSICGVALPTALELDRICRDRESRDGVVGGFIGRIHPDKGIEEIINSVEKLSDIAGFEFWFIGDLELVPGSRLARDFDDLLTLDNVTHFPYTKSLDRYLSKIDFLVLPSYREGFGLIVAEAAAFGVPTIISKIYGLKDHVDNGCAPVVVEPRDPVTLFKAMARMIDDGQFRREIGSELHQIVSKHYDQRAIVRSMKAIIIEQAKGIGRK